MNERAFLAQLESANTDELSQILRRPTAEEERVLEIYFGRDRLQRLRGLALRTQQRATPRGNVVVLHGIMGGAMQTGLAVVFGLLLALAVGRVLSQILYKVSPNDLFALITSSLLLAAASLLACFFPAQRATKVTPMKALRTE